MKKFILLMLCFISYKELNALERKVLRKDQWFISRIVKKKDYFSDAHNKAAETALAIEPYYTLQIPGSLGVTVSSPLKKIKRIDDYFLIFTLHGTIYKAWARNLLIMNNFNKFYRINNLSFGNIYQRRNIHDLQQEINNKQILPLQNYKTWSRYISPNNFGEPENINLSEKLLHMRSHQSVYYDLTEDDLATLMLFHQQ